MNEFFSIYGVLAWTVINTIALLLLVAWALYNIDQ